MGEEKGKGRASDSRDASVKDGQAAAEAPIQSSVFSRITSSAASLASSAFSAPSSNEINDGRAALLGDSGKSLPPATGTSNTSSLAESSRSTDQILRANGSEPARLRNGHEDQHIQQMESEFSSFLDGIEPLIPSQENTLPADHMHNHAADLFAPTQDSFLRDTMRTSESNSEHAHQQRDRLLTVDEQEKLDGEEVLGILRSPSAMDEDMEIHAELDDYDLHLTPKQIQMIRSITDKFFPPPRPHLAPPADHPLNLRPDLDVSPITTVSQFQSATNSDESYMYFGPENETQEAWRVFMDQWDNLLTGYTDEVWGDLLPLVKEAREEIETSKDSGKPPTTQKALRRLGLILRHFQK